MFGSYENFEKELDIVFGKVNEKRIAERQFVKFYQIKSVSYYIAQFR